MVMMFSNLVWSNQGDQFDFLHRNVDDVGNLYETKEKTDRVYGAGSRLLETREATFSYDEEGNLIQKVEKNGDTWKYEYNGNGMMSKVVRPDKTVVTFKYDSLGRRIEKSFDEKTTRFVWDGNNILHEYYSQDNSDIFENLDEYSSQNKSQIPDNLVTWVFNEGFIPSAKITNEGNYSIVSDYLGTPVEAYDEQGNSVWSAELDIYGRMKEFTGEKDFIPFRYQGQYEDIETGLYYNRFRYYSPTEGIYTQSDPIGLAGGNPTLYGYVGDPNISIDPLGLFFSDVKWKKGKNKWKSGELGTHYNKHVVKQGEFGDISQNEYHDLMEQFLADESPGMKQAKVGNQLIKVDPATNRVLAGHAKDGKILSFYIALPEFVVEDPFTDAVNYALEKTKLSKSEVKYKC